MIIDTHAHLGSDHVFDEEFTEAALVASQRRNGIDVTIVQPALVHDLETVRKQHDDIADLCRRHPGRFRGMADPNPHLGDAKYADEVKRCVEDLGFVGVKMHPFAHAVNPLGRAGRRMFEACVRHNVPAMVHTGLGIPWAAPSLLDTVARDMPEFTIVVAHAGGGIFAQETIGLARKHRNVYLESSWCAGFLLFHWVREIGAERVMFGSDHADNAATELARFRSFDYTPDELALLLGGTAAEVYKIGARV